MCVCVFDGGMGVMEEFADVSHVCALGRGHYLSSDTSEIAIATQHSQQ